MFATFQFLSTSFIAVPVISFPTYKSNVVITHKSLCSTIRINSKAKLKKWIKNARPLKSYATWREQSSGDKVHHGGNRRMVNKNALNHQWKRHLSRWPKNRPRIDHSFEWLNRDYRQLNSSGHTASVFFPWYRYIRFERVDSEVHQNSEINNRIISWGICNDNRMYGFVPKQQ